MFCFRGHGDWLHSVSGFTLLHTIRTRLILDADNACGKNSKAQCDERFSVRVITSSSTETYLLESTVDVAVIQMLKYLSFGDLYVNDGWSGTDGTRSDSADARQHAFLDHRLLRFESLRQIAFNCLTQNLVQFILRPEQQNKDFF